MSQLHKICPNCGFEKCWHKSPLCEKCKHDFNNPPPKFSSKKKLVVEDEDQPKYRTHAGKPQRFRITSLWRENAVIWFNWLDYGGDGNDHSVVMWAKGVKENWLKEFNEILLPEALAYLILVECPTSKPKSFAPLVKKFKNNVEGLEKLLEGA